MSPEKIIQPNKQTKLTPVRARTFTLFSIVWLIALVLPAYNDTTNYLSSMQGWEVFVFGPIGLLGGNYIAGISWSANIFAIIALFYMLSKKYQVAFIFAIIAFLLSLLALTITQYMSDTLVYVRPDIAVYLWILSMLILLVGSRVTVRQSKI